MDLKQQLLDLGIKIQDIPPVQPTKEVPPIKYSDNQKLIDAKRAELELRKLEMEIEKLNAPNTSMDYFKEMLQLQQQHFTQLLTMQKEQSNLLLEIEKLKLGGETDDGMAFMLDIIKPILPQILAKKMESKDDKKGVTMNKEEYIKQIKEGKITLEQAWEDFKMELPTYAEKMTLEQFKEQYEKIKNGN
jgi:hypothetical protein